MKKLLFVLACLGLASGCAHRLPNYGSRLPDYPPDPGYFLTLKQKGQLIFKGRVQDSRGGWYNIWICPGYTEPLRSMKDGLYNAVTPLKDLGDFEHFKDMKHQSRDAFDFAFENCIEEFMIEGIPQSWEKYFDRAGERAEQRVFGWWLAYPWATMQSSVASATRLTFGSAGAVIGVVGGLAVIPGWHVVKHVGDPTMESAGVLVNDVVLQPVTAVAWNTLVSPPLAVAGQKPAPQRVDGFWVRFISPEDLEFLVSRTPRPIDAAEKETLQPFGAFLQEHFSDFVKEMNTLNQSHNQRQQELHREYQKARQEMDAAMKKTLEAWVSDPGHEEAVDLIRYLKGRGHLDQMRLNSILEEVRVQGGLKSQDVHHLRRLLRGISIPHRIHENAIDHTDPVKESIRVIDEID
ncbi:MAG: hypothetical protein AAF492_07905 [Verrucomicrobiota bacterium]